MNALEELGYAFCSKCNGHLPPDDLVQGMCLWCWANEPDEGGEG